ncbi:hypothetical protein J1N35_017435 [Gossypium stocksii]|uniref:Uncharacterized protein n=1 Tax=Gossypium stocksii TaxID=47602 RepID=A0A9D3VP17_9ROSI|nr:hypothetical protein J1N35_017435 [Gossypium stocksii]
MHAGKLVGHFIGNARNSWEERISTSPEPDSYLPKLNELWPSNANPKIDKAESYLLNDCPMLPYTSASEDLPCFDITSTSSFSCQGSEFHRKKSRLFTWRFILALILILPLSLNTNLYASFGTTASLYLKVYSSTETLFFSF